MNYRKLYRKFLVCVLAAGLSVSCLTACDMPSVKKVNTSSGSDSSSTDQSQTDGQVQEEEVNSEEVVHTADEEISADLTVEKEEVDTTGMLPVEYSYENGSIGFYLPDGWSYHIDSYSEDQGSFAIAINPSDQEEGQITLEYYNGNVAEWQGAEEIGAEMYGYLGYLGSYPDTMNWGYFLYPTENGSYMIINSASDFWWADEEETINKILSTISFGEPLFSDPSYVEVNSESDFAGKSLTISYVSEETQGEEEGFAGGALSAVYDGQEITLVDYCVGVRNSYLLPISETCAYVLVPAVYDNDYAETFLLKLDTEAEQVITLCDSLEAGISQHEGVTAAGFGLSFRVNVLGSYNGERHYTINQDKFYTNDPWLHIKNNSGDYMDVWDNTEGMDGETLTMMSYSYTEDGRKCLTLKTDLTAFSSGGEEIVIPAGTQICPTDVDLDANTFYFDFMQYDEAFGEFLTNYGYVIYEGEVGGQLTIDGKDENDLFEAIPYAG